LFYCKKTARLTFEVADVMLQRTRPARSRNIIAVAETKSKLQKKSNVNQNILHKRLSDYKIKFNLDREKLMVKRIKNTWERLGYLKAASLYTVAALITGFLVYGSVIAADVHFAKEALVNGKTVGVIKNTSNFEMLVEDMRKSLSTTLGKEVSPIGKPVYILRLVFGKSLTGEYALRQNVLSAFDDVEEAYAVYVNDSLICAALSEDIVKNVLDKIKSQFSEDDVNAEIGFVENISIRKEFIPVGYVRSADGVYAALTSPLEGQKTYAVTANDTIWGIANKFAMSVDEIYCLNKDLNDIIHEGDEIIINKSEPLVRVQSKYIYKGEKAIPYETDEVQDFDLQSGKKTVVTAGVEGKKYVVEEVVKQNGEVIETNVISEEILSQPVAATVKVGMKKSLSSVATTGRLSRPVYGTISSRFGYRARGFHSGLDIAAPTGTPITAADGGTVNFSGWNGGYGYLVRIDHGGGFETYYGHCSAMLVSVGDKVSKGDIIAKVGNTGNSTGPHCHFEVRVNGVAQNPSNYLN